MTNLTLPNYTQLPNNIIDEHLDTLTGSEIKIILVIARKTIGFHKEVDSISSSQLIYFTGMKRDTVFRSIKSLEEKRFILVDRDGIGKMNKYTLNMNLSPKSDTLSNQSPFSDSHGCDSQICDSEKSDTQKKTIHKRKLYTKENEHSCESKEKSSEVETSSTEIKDEEIGIISEFLSIGVQEMKSNIAKSNWLCELIYQTNKKRKLFFANKYQYHNLKRGTDSLLKQSDVIVAQAIETIERGLNDDFWRTQVWTEKTWSSLVGLSYGRSPKGKKVTTEEANREAKKYYDKKRRLGLI